MKEHSIDGLHVTDFEGNGQTLIFVHAFPLNSSMWKPQVDFFKNHFRVITYDTRGLGKSKSPDNQFTMESYADDFLKIAEHLNLNEIIACGLSMGGYIIQRSYLKNPVLFKSLILADTKSERDDNNGLISRANVINMIKSGKRKNFIDDFIPKLINKNSFQNSGLKNHLEEIISLNADDGICGAQLALATRIHSTDFLPSFNLPVLILVGEDDILTPLPCSQTMNSFITGSILKIIPSSGHLSNIENPERFNEEILNFVRRI